MKAIFFFFHIILFMAGSVRAIAHNSLPLVPESIAEASAEDCISNNQTIFFYDPENNMVHVDLLAVENTAKQISISQNGELIMALDLSMAQSDAIVEIPFSWQPSGAYSIELKTDCDCHYSQHVEWGNGEIAFVVNQ